MLCFGLLIGFISRLLDIFTTNLGEIFSQMAIWILVGTLISIYSKNAKKAMLNVLTFCLGTRIENTMIFVEVKTPVKLLAMANNERKINVIST